MYTLIKRKYIKATIKQELQAQGTKLCCFIAYGIHQLCERGKLENLYR